MHTPCRLSLVQDVAIVTITNLGIEKGRSFSAQEVEEVTIATVLSDHQNWAWQDPEIKKKPHSLTVKALATKEKTQKPQTLIMHQKENNMTDTGQDMRNALRQISTICVRLKADLSALC